VSGGRSDVTDRIDRPSFSDVQVAAFRLRRHHLDLRASRGRLESVVGDICGVQAQVMGMARIALWARLRQLTVTDVERAIEQKRTIVKTWSMRGTLHLHPSGELPVVLGGLMATRLAHEQRRIRRLGLKEEETTSMILKALADGPLTRGQLSEHLGTRLGTKAEDWTDGGWGRKTVGTATTWQLVRPGVVRGLVCFGPSDGQEITFARTDQWLRDPPSRLSEVEAEEAFLRRYLRSFGPSDVHDMRAWSGIHVRRLRTILGRLGDELLEVERDGGAAFLLRKDLPDLEAATGDGGVVRLLPSFDAFLLGHRGRDHLVDRAHYKDVYKDQGWLAPVVLVDGRVEGTWSYQRKPRSLDVAVRMFTSFGRETRRRLEEEARDLSRFLEAGAAKTRFTK